MTKNKVMNKFEDKKSWNSDFLSFIVNYFSGFKWVVSMSSTLPFQPSPKPQNAIVVVIVTSVFEPSSLLRLCCHIKWNPLPSLARSQMSLFLSVFVFMVKIYSHLNWLKVKLAQFERKFLWLTSDTKIFWWEFYWLFECVKFQNKSSRFAITFFIV